MHWNADFLVLVENQGWSCSISIGRGMNAENFLSDVATQRQFKDSWHFWCETTFYDLRFWGGELLDLFEFLATKVTSRYEIFVKLISEEFANRFPEISSKNSKNKKMQISNSISRKKIICLMRFHERKKESYLVPQCDSFINFPPNCKIFRQTVY